MATINENQQNPSTGENKQEQLQSEDVFSNMSEKIHYESDPYFHREFCRECGSKNVFTRCYFHELSLHARWLCYNCADDYINKRGYKLVTATLNY